MDEEELFKIHNLKISQKEKEVIKKKAQEVAAITMGSYLDVLEKLLQMLHLFDFDALVKALEKPTDNPELLEE